MRLVREKVRISDQIPRMLFGKQLWQTSSSRDSRLSSTLCALGFAASGVHSRAENSEGDTIARDATDPDADDNENNSGTTRKAYTTQTSVFSMESAPNHIMASRSRPLIYGLLGANVAVYSAFTIGFFLNRPPKPSPTLLRFLSRNFVLSPGWLSRGRWHVMLTCMFAHLTWEHLFRNICGILTGVWACSEVLDTQQIAGLYFAGGLVGASASVTLTKILRKARFVTFVTGASDGIYALWYYCLCVKDWEAFMPPSVPLNPIMRALFLYFFAAECIGLRKYIRYGYTGTGRNAVRGNHAAHLGGAVTGLMAYGVPRITENIWKNERSNHEDEAVERKEIAENVKEPTVATGRVRA